MSWKDTVPPSSLLLHKFSLSLSILSRCVGSEETGSIDDIVMCGCSCIGKIQPSYGACDLVGGLCRVFGWLNDGRDYVKSYLFRLIDHPIAWFSSSSGLTIYQL
jgi:hypothetical protein